MPEEEFAECVAFTANIGRAHFSHRVAVISQTKEDFLKQLETNDYLMGQASVKRPKIAFIFSGKTDENTELKDTSPVFKEAMERSNGLPEYAFFSYKNWGIVPDL